MHLQIALLADRVKMHSFSHYDFIGVKTLQEVESFPWTWRRPNLVVRLIAEASDTEGDHVLEVMVRFDDKTVFAFRPIIHHFDRSLGREGTHIIVKYKALQFGLPGTYRFDIYWDGSFLQSILLDIILKEDPTDS